MECEFSCTSDWSRWRVIALHVSFNSTVGFIYFKLPR